MMKCQMSVVIQTERSGFRTLLCSVDLPFPPSVDQEFAYPLWNSPKKPTSVTFTLDDGEDSPVLSTISIRFMEELAQEMSLDQHAQLYIDRGWEAPANRRRSSC